LRFRAPPEVHRRTPTPSRRSEDRHVGRCFLSWAFSPYDTCRNGGPVHSAGRPAPRRAASEVSVPPSRRTPPSLLTPFGIGASLGFTLQGVLLESMGIPLGTPALVSFFASVRRAPMGSGRTRAATGLPSRLELVLLRVPEGTRCVDAFLGFSRPERSLPPSRHSALGRGASPRTRSSGLTSKSVGVPGCSGTEESARPSRDRRLSSGSSPFDRRGTAALGVEGGLMVSPHDSSALQAARTDPCPLTTEPTEV